MAHVTEPAASSTAMASSRSMMSLSSSSSSSLSRSCSLAIDFPFKFLSRPKQPSQLIRFPFVNRPVAPSTRARQGRDDILERKHHASASDPSTFHSADYRRRLRSMSDHQVRTNPRFGLFDFAAVEVSDRGSGKWLAEY